MRKLIVAALGAALLAAPLPASAQASFAAYDAVHEALVAVWDELPLSVRNVTLIDGAATGLGQYQPHAGKSFKADEPVNVYAELYGYGVLSRANGGYVRQLGADLALIDASGAIRANQIGFWNSSDTFERRPLEVHLSFSATLSAFPPGEYVLRFTVHDKGRGQQVSFDVPVALSE